MCVCKVCVCKVHKLYLAVWKRDVMWVELPGCLHCPHRDASHTPCDVSAQYPLHSCHHAQHSFTKSHHLHISEADNNDSNWSTFSTAHLLIWYWWPATLRVLLLLSKLKALGINSVGDTEEMAADVIFSASEYALELILAAVDAALLVQGAATAFQGTLQGAAMWVVKP